MSRQRRIGIIEITHELICQDADGVLKSVGGELLGMVSGNETSSLYLFEHPDFEVSRGDMEIPRYLPHFTRHSDGTVTRDRIEKVLTINLVDN